MWLWPVELFPRLARIFLRLAQLFLDSLHHGEHADMKMSVEPPEISHAFFYITQNSLFPVNLPASTLGPWPLTGRGFETVFITNKVLTYYLQIYRVLSVFF
jgi:hypothetical protein